MNPLTSRLNEASRAAQDRIRARRKARQDEAMKRIAELVVRDVTKPLDEDELHELHILTQRHNLTREALALLQGYAQGQHDGTVTKAE